MLFLCLCGIFFFRQFSNVIFSRGVRDVKSMLERERHIHILFFFLSLNWTLHNRTRVSRLQHRVKELLLPARRWWWYCRRGGGRTIDMQHYASLYFGGLSREKSSYCFCCSWCWYCCSWMLFDYHAKFSYEWCGVMKTPCSWVSKSENDDTICFKLVVLILYNIITAVKTPCMYLTSLIIFQQT